MLFQILMGLDIIAAAIVAYFFMVGLADGSVSDFNIGLWTGILLAFAAVFAGGLALRRTGWTKLANAVLALLAVPTLLYGIFILVVLASGESWN